MMKNKILAAFLSLSVALAPAAASATGYIIQEPESITETYKPPELSFSFAEKGTTLTLTTDLYLVTPDTWALIIYERTALVERLELEYQERLAIQKERARLVLDVREAQLEYTNDELERTNKLLQKVQKQKSVKDWTPLIVVGAVILGALITTTTVFAVTNGDGV